MVRNPNGDPVHEDGCPESAPEPEPVFYAHDPLSDTDGSSLVALERLRAFGHGLTKVRQHRPVTAEVHEAIGSFEPEVFELKTEELRRRAGLGSMQPVPGGPVLAPSIGVSRYGSRRRKTT